MAMQTCFAQAILVRSTTTLGWQVRPLPHLPHRHYRNFQDRRVRYNLRNAASIIHSTSASFSVYEHNTAPPDVKQGSRLPVLVYLPGLDGAALPEFQVETLRVHYRVLSMLPAAGDRSNWDALAFAVLSGVNADSFTLVGESFGAALALRVTARAPERVEHLVLLNSGTALRSATVARGVVQLLPVLRVPGLYRVAARILTYFLADADHLHASVALAEDGALFDIVTAPLPDVIHRVHLLESFNSDFSDDCIQSLVTAPTSIIAAAGDQLLPSLLEVRRLERVLPDLRRVVVLPDAPHAALLDRRVSLAEIVGDKPPETSEDRATLAQQLEYAEALRAGTKFFEPWRRLVAPWIGGLERVREALTLADDMVAGARRRPIVFVGNHGKFGLLDLSLLYLTLAREVGVSGGQLRGLAHSTHFAQFDELSDGRWGQFVRALGGVKASPRAFYSLLRARERILLFPGGAREVCCRRGEEHLLRWSDTVEFVRPAARFDALIVPFSAIGADDDCTTIFDGQELQRLPVVGDAVRRYLDENGFDKEDLMPVTTPPRMRRYYFQFHDIIDTAQLDSDDDDACRDMYQQIRSEVQGGIDDLLHRRKEDPLSSLGARVLKGVLDGSRKVLKIGDVPLFWADRLMDFDF